VASVTNALKSASDDCWNHIGVRGDRSCAELERHIHCRNCPVFAAAARALLDVPSPAGGSRIATEHFARPAPAEPEYAVGTDTESVVVFRLQAEWHAIRTAACLEIVEWRPIHSLPHRRNGAVLGVANVGGALLVCLSLALILGVTPQPDPVPTPSRRRAAVPRLLVVRGTGGAVAFPVDEVQGTERFRLRDLKDVPATIAQAKAARTQALIALGDKTVGLLDEQLLFHAVEQALA
jgi:chemotaxis-related protein WspD